ncbi:GlsB/YeaQ/YmgE family stress response membrane protein [Streptomyces sp. V4-01]|uniref:GlsB/YeaQ/YmgE family stress response membrane protein n=1 Tax=Actinacidiphila polyblastidii TaxID=3110430 RepID=A0ABU7P6F9_9ACTN|nr:GlsB/YeaQ/YmgE family stress response membrane protein [Streptomyces sp. V4-01]
MGWLWAIIVGLVLGLIAKAILPGKQTLPLWLTVLAGIGGGVLGNGVSSWLGVRDTKGFDWTRHALQLVGAIVLVAICDAAWRAYKSRKSSGRATSTTSSHR